MSSGGWLLVGVLVEWHDNHARRVAARQTRRGDQP
jgi:hypothetical protein